MNSAEAPRPEYRAPVPLLWEGNSFSICCFFLPGSTVDSVGTLVGQLHGEAQRALVFEVAAQQASSNVSSALLSLVPAPGQCARP